MPLQTFSFPLPETRFFRAGSCIYKFKISGSSSFRGEQVTRLNNLHQELEDIIRTVLGNLDSLQPFYSAHFNVYPYKKEWKGASKMTRKHGEGKLSAYPFSLILYLERNMHNEEAEQAEKMSPEEEVAQNLPSVSEPESKRRRRYSPLEDAILKDLLQDLEAESKLSVAGRPFLKRPRPQSKAKEDPGHVDKKASKNCDELGQKSGVEMVRRNETQGEVHPESTQHTGEEEGEEEEEEEEEEENSDSVPGTPVKPGILSRLASRIFPFSLLFRDS